MDKYVRICPSCGHEIKYKSYSAWHSANKKNSEAVPTKDQPLERLICLYC